MRVEEHESDTRRERRTSGRSTTKSISTERARSVDPAAGMEGCRAYPGRSVTCRRKATEVIERSSDRVAGVSRGHSTCEVQGRPERMGDE